MKQQKKNTTTDAFLAAIDRRDTDSVESLIRERGADPNATDGAGYTALHRAIRSGGAETVRLLLQAGADPDAAIGPGRRVPPLHFAVQTKNPEIVRALLDAGADPGAVDWDGEVALHWCVLYDDEESARILLGRGVDTDARDDNGETPLHYAVHFRSARMVRLLLDAGADPYTGAFREAVLLGDRETVRVFLRHGYVPLRQQRKEDQIGRMIESRIRQIEQAYERSVLLSAARGDDVEGEVARGVQGMPDDVFRQLVRSIAHVPSPTNQKQQFRRWCQQKKHRPPEDMEPLLLARRLDQMRRQKKRSQR